MFRTPGFAFLPPSTWTRALAILVEELDLTFLSARIAFYAKVQRRKPSDRELNSICEQLLFALNQLAALNAISGIPNKADVARIGIVAWYYGVYGAASAMIAAGDGSFPETHATTAQQWDRQFAANGLAMAPFGDRISSRFRTETVLITANVSRSPTSSRAAEICHNDLSAVPQSIQVIGPPLRHRHALLPMFPLA